jgi:hypothetical protein
MTASSAETCSVFSSRTSRHSSVGTPSTLVFSQGNPKPFGIGVEPLGGMVRIAHMPEPGHEEGMGEGLSVHVRLKFGQLGAG